jgi:hypothetical protein
MNKIWHFHAMEYFSVIRKKCLYGYMLTTLAKLENIILRQHKPVIEESLLYDFILMKCPTYEQAVSDRSDLWSC